MKKVIYKYNPLDDIDNSILKYLNCVIFALKLNLEYEYEDLIQEIEEYKYFRGLDYNCNDYGAMLGSPYYSLREYADANDEIYGFNTLGYFKSKIELDKLISTDWINPYNSHGLFVKNVTKISKDNFNIIYNGEIDFYNLKVIEICDYLVPYLKDKEKIMEYIESNKFNHYIRIKNQEKILINNLINEIKSNLINILKV
jgi:hypothetical protein